MDDKPFLFLPKKFFIRIAGGDPAFPGKIFCDRNAGIGMMPCEKPLR
jgi:hypothetical protein